MNQITDNAVNTLKHHGHHNNEEHCATTGQVERLAIEGYNTTNGTSARTQDSVYSTSKDGADQARYFAGESLNGNRANFAATKNAEKEILVQASDDTMRIINSGADHYADTVSTVTSGTASVIGATSDGFTRAATSGAYQTSQIVDKVTGSSYESALRDATNTSNILLSQTLGYKDGVINANLNAAAIGVQAEKIGAAGTLQASMIGNDTQSKMASGFCAVEKEILVSNIALKDKLAALEGKGDNNFYQIQIKSVENAKDAQHDRDVIHLESQRQADANTAKILADAAACCCKTEKLIMAEGDATRELIRSMKIDTLARELSDTKDKLNFANLRASLLPAQTPAVVVA